MGAAVGAVLVRSGCTVLTNLDGRSESTHKRAEAAGLQDVPFTELVSRADYFLSILPPSDAYALARKVVGTISSPTFSRQGLSSLVYADCNAVNPQTVKRIAALFDDTGIRFVDSSIIGGPPSETYSPTFYASARLEDGEILEGFVRLSDYGLKIKALRGEGVGVGDASALKMSYAVSECVRRLITGRANK
jgi:3-hydroxyisobutyrate dehydrogenase-like beta-hydroxyacid dehydrogenase